jgi:hypothetical protein
VDTIHITSADDRYSVRAALRKTTGRRVLFVLPWEIEKGWDSVLDYEILMREVKQRDVESVWVVEDPARQPYARDVGFPIFNTEEEAHAYLEQNGTLPPANFPKFPPKPRKPWWMEEPEARVLPLPHRQPLWLLGVKGLVLLVVLGIAGLTVFLAMPSAHIILFPEGITYATIVPISVDPELEQVDLQRNVIPARRIGDEFEGYAQVATTGRGYAFSGRARGRVYFTNLLGQDYRVPKGTIVRTSSTSFPVRFATTQEVVLPAFGQAEAPIEALEEGPRGNVSAYQINQVEGVAGFAIRVTNLGPTSGAEREVIPTVAEADKTRVWDLAAERVLAEAYNRLQDSSYLQPGEFLPRQALVIQAVPKQAYTHLVGEKTNTLGLMLRLLITGQAVHVSDVQAVAYRKLATLLPEDYTLTDARFEYGEAAEEDVGPGIFTFYVTAHAYASQEIDTEAVEALVLGKRIENAEEAMLANLPLSAPPEITVTPTWFPWIPRLPIRTHIEVVPGQHAERHPQ